ncbi:tigger transposable element-derived protein 6 [Biomphalaria glabrata]|nr:tigger transposable element-derived protein 6 [Biomphalaria glabrata]
MYVVDLKKFKANQIYNVDEKGITTVQSNNAKIIALKGKKQIGVLSSAERGRTVTTVICMSAAGEYVPPMFIFPCQRMKMEQMDGAPPGSIYTCHKTGWIQLDLFTQWFRHFIHFVKPSQLAIAVNGFEKTSIWPVNRNIFQDWEFKAAETTDIQVASNEIQEQQMNSAMDLPSTSNCSNLELGDQEPFYKSWGPADISPFPVARCERGKGKRRRKGCTAVLTSSPYKQTLGEPSTSKCVPNQHKARKPIGKSSNLDDNDTPCIYCNGLFSEDTHGEQWIQCVACSKWAHTECAGAESSIF